MQGFLSKAALPPPETLLGSEEFLKSDYERRRNMVEGYFVDAEQRYGYDQGILEDMGKAKAMAMYDLESGRLGEVVSSYLGEGNDSPEQIDTAVQGFIERKMSGGKPANAAEAIVFSQLDRVGRFEQFRQEREEWHRFTDDGIQDSDGRELFAIRKRYHPSRNDLWSVRFPDGHTAVAELGESPTDRDAVMAAVKHGGFYTRYLGARAKHMSPETARRFEQKYGNFRDDMNWAESAYDTLASGFTSGLSTTVRGVKTLGLEALNPLNHAFNELEQKTGFKYPLRADKWIGKAVDAIDDAVQRQAPFTPDVLEGGTDLSNPKWWVQHGSRVAGQMALSFGSAGLAGKLANTERGTKFAQIFGFGAPGSAAVAGNVYTEALEYHTAQGMDPSAAARWSVLESIATGVVTFAAESASGKYLTNNSAALAAAQGYVRDAMGALAVRGGTVLAKGGIEGATEVVQETAAVALEALVREDPTRLTAERDAFRGFLGDGGLESLRQSSVVAAGALGFGAGGAFGAISPIPAATGASQDVAAAPEAAPEPDVEENLPKLARDLVSGKAHDYGQARKPQVLDAQDFAVVRIPSPFNESTNPNATRVGIQQMPPEDIAVESMEAGRELADAVTARDVIFARLDEQRSMAPDDSRRFSVEETQALQTRLNEIDRLIETARRKQDVPVTERGVRTFASKSDAEAYAQDLNQTAAQTAEAGAPAEKVAKAGRKRLGEQIYTNRFRPQLMEDGHIVDIRNGKEILPKDKETRKEAVKAVNAAKAEAQRRAGILVQAGSKGNTAQVPAYGVHRVELGSGRRPPEAGPYYMYEVYVGQPTGKGNVQSVSDVDQDTSVFNEMGPPADMIVTTPEMEVETTIERQEPDFIVTEPESETQVFLDEEGGVETEIKEATSPYVMQEQPEQEQEQQEGAPAPQAQPQQGTAGNRFLEGLPERKARSGRRPQMPNRVAGRPASTSPVTPQSPTPEKIAEAMRRGEITGNHKTFYEKLKAKIDQKALDPLNMLASPVSSRLFEIHPELGAVARLAEFETFARAGNWGHRAAPFIKWASKLSKNDANAVDYLLLNGRYDVVEGMAAETSGEAAAGVRELPKLLEEIHGQVVASGRKIGHIDGYFPRKLKFGEYENLLRALTKNQLNGILDKEIKKFEDKHGPASPEERQEITNRLLYKFSVGNPDPAPGFTKARVLQQVGVELMDKYEPSVRVLSNYIRKAAEDVTRREYYGMDDAGRFDEIGSTIGGVVSRLYEQGEITPEQFNEVKGILNTRKHYAHLPPGIVSDIVGAGYSVTIMNMISAMTQFSDLAISGYKNGYFAIPGAGQYDTATVDRSDIFVEPTIELTMTGTVQKFTQRFSKASGFDAVDAFGKKAFLTGWLRKAANMTPEAFEKEISGYERFLNGKSPEQIQKEIRDGKKNHEILFLAFSMLSDFHPISVLEMPEVYLKYPIARPLYMLKSFALKQLDRARRDGIGKIVEGTKKGDAKMVGEGITKLVTLAGGLALAAAGVDEAKQFILGREVSFSDNVQNNLLKLMLMSKYRGEKLLKNEKDSLMDWITEVAFPMPAVEYLTSNVQDVGRVVLQGADAGETLKQSRFLRQLPVVGSIPYYWLGRGREKEDEAAMEAYKAVYKEPVAALREEKKELDAIDEDKLTETQKLRKTHINRIIGTGIPGLQSHYDQAVNDALEAGDTMQAEKFKRQIIRLIENPDLAREEMSLLRQGRLKGYVDGAY